MSAYDLFALHLIEREAAHIDLERRRRILEHLARETPSKTDASAPESRSALRAERLGRVRLLRRA